LTPYPWYIQPRTHGISERKIPWVEDSIKHMLGV
jgi:hypothetical protein